MPTSADELRLRNKGYARARSPKVNLGLMPKLRQKSNPYRNYALKTKKEQKAPFFILKLPFLHWFIFFSNNHSNYAKPSNHHSQLAWLWHW
jgi:hypothetical protein